MIQKDLFIFTGEQAIYDDGIFRIHLPVELIRKNETNEESVKFEILDEPYLIEWTTIVLGKSQIEDLGCASEKIEDVMRFFISDLDEGAPLQLICMANGFNMAIHECSINGESHTYFLLGEFVDGDTFVGTSLDITAPNEYISTYKSVEMNKRKSSVKLTAQQDPPKDIIYPALCHLLKGSMRRAYYSHGEARINSSTDWLYVARIGIQFPSEIGSMSYWFASDYESTGPGEGISLRYIDEEGRNADIYIYDKTEELIEPGPDSEQVLLEMEATVSDMEAFYEPSVPKLLREEVSRFGRDGFPLLDKRFLIGGEEADEGGKMTAVLLTARLGAFIKIRFSALPGEIDVENACLTSFMNDLANILN